MTEHCERQTWHKEYGKSPDSCHVVVVCLGAIVVDGLAAWIARGCNCTATPVFFAYAPTPNHVYILPTMSDPFSDPQHNKASCIFCSTDVGRCFGIPTTFATRDYLEHAFDTSYLGR